MNKIGLFLNSLRKNKKKKNLNKTIMLLMLGGAAFSLLIIVAIIFIIIFLPFVGQSFHSEVNKNSDDPSKQVALDMKDPMDNKGFVEELKKAIKYGDSWNEILAAVQAKRMIYSTDKITLEDAANAVKTGTVNEWLKSPPPDAKPDIVKNMDHNEFERTYEHYKNTIRYNVGPYVGHKNIEQIKTVSLNGGTVEKWVYNPSLGRLSFEIVGKDGLRVPYEYYGVAQAKVYPDLKAAESELKELTIARKYAEKVVILQTSKDPSGELGIIVNFPLDKKIEVEDDDITSAVGLMSKLDNSGKEPTMPLGQSPDEAGMATYIKAKVGTPVIIPENVKVLKTYYNDKLKSYSVVFQSLDNERRYKFENLSNVVAGCAPGRIYISHTGGSVVFGYAGKEENGKGLVKMNTYVNFQLIFKEDMEENVTATTEASIGKSSIEKDPAVSDGFYEVDSYKAALIMKESRVKTGEENPDIDKVFPLKESQT